MGNEAKNAIFCKLFFLFTALVSRKLCEMFWFHNLNHQHFNCMQVLQKYRKMHGNLGISISNFNSNVYSILAVHNIFFVFPLKCSWEMRKIMLMNKVEYEYLSQFWSSYNYVLCHACNVFLFYLTIELNFTAYIIAN